MIRCWGCDFFSFFLTSRVLVVDIPSLLFSLCGSFRLWCFQSSPAPSFALFFVMAIYYLCSCSIPDPTRHARNTTRINQYDNHGPLINLELSSTIIASLSPQDLHNPYDSKCSLIRPFKSMLNVVFQSDKPKKPSRNLGAVYNSQ